jgi:hypothetical protein
MAKWEIFDRRTCWTKDFFYLFPSSTHTHTEKIFKKNKSVVPSGLLPFVCHNQTGYVPSQVFQAPEREKKRE